MASLEERPDKQIILVAETIERSSSTIVAAAHCAIDAWNSASCEAAGSRRRMAGLRRGDAKTRHIRQITADALASNEAALFPGPQLGCATVVAEDDPSLRITLRLD
jgi:hypothetical protein